MRCAGAPGTCSSAASTLSEPTAAAEVAQRSVTAEPFDERAVRDLMRALVAGGRRAAALLAYDELARELREELGTDPAVETSELHLAVLRAGVLPEDRVVARPRSGAPALVGREPELAEVERAWSDAVRGRGGLLVVEGEAGIGKTRLLDAAEELVGRTGGQVLRPRCHPAERSLFLQPFLDALRPVLLDQHEGALAGLLRDHEEAWVSLLPEIGSVLGPNGRRAARRRPAGAGPTRRSPRCCAVSPCGDPCCWCSTTCTTAARRRWTSSATCPDAWTGPGCCCWPRSAPSTSRSWPGWPTGPHGSTWVRSRPPPSTRWRPPRGSPCTGPR